MCLFCKKGTKEYKDLESFGGFFCLRLYSRKFYLKPYNEFLDTYKELSLLEERNVLQSWCKSYKIDYKKLVQLLNKYKSVSEVVKERNDEYLKKHLSLDKLYLVEVF